MTGRPKYRRIPNQPSAGDLVDRNFARSEPDRLWVTDITEHPTSEGKVYCSGDIPLLAMITPVEFEARHQPITAA